MPQIFPPIGTNLQVTFPSTQNVVVTNVPAVLPEGTDAAGVVHPIATDAAGKTLVESQSLLEVMTLILQELRALKLAIVSLDNTLLPQDFEVSSVQAVTNDQS